MPIPLPPLIRPDAALTVLDITEFYGPTSGGVRTYLEQKAAWVAAQRDMRQVVLVPGERDAVDDREGSRRYAIRGPRVPGQPPYRFFLARRSTRLVVEHERPDIIELGSPGFVPWIAARARRGRDIPMVAFFHSNFPRIYTPFPERVGSLRRFATDMLWRYVRYIDRFAEVTIACSDFAADDLRRAGVDNVVRLPLGVDLAHFHPSRRARRDETRARYGLPDDALVSAYVGRFAHEKEIDTLVAGWPAVHARTGAHLAVIGDGPTRPLLEEMVKPYPFVHLLPYERDRERLADLHAALDFYAAPGPVETFGLSGLEALASGTPVVSVHRGGVAEQVTASGAGTHYAAGRPETIAPAVELLLAKDQAELSRLARAHAERDHAWETVFARLRALYEDVLARHR